MLVIRVGIFKLTTMTGLFILLWLSHHSVFHQVPTLALLNNCCFWHQLGVIGAVLYLLADECKGCKSKKDKEGQKEVGKSSSAAPVQGGKKGKGKKE